MDGFCCLFIFFFLKISHQKLDAFIHFYMKSIIVKDTFYDSPIVQGLRLLYSKCYAFSISTEINSDLFFPFCGNLAFAVFYPDNLNKDGITRIKSISKVYNNIIVIVCVSPEDAQLYKHFLCAISTKVDAVVCFPHDNFSKLVSSFIYDTIQNFKLKTRELQKELEHERNYNSVLNSIECDEKKSDLC